MTLPLDPQKVLEDADKYKEEWVKSVSQEDSSLQAKSPSMQDIDKVLEGKFREAFETAFLRGTAEASGSADLLPDGKQFIDNWVAALSTAAEEAVIAELRLQKKQIAKIISQLEANGDYRNRNQIYGAHLVSKQLSKRISALTDSVKGETDNGI